MSGPCTFKKIDELEKQQTVWPENMASAAAQELCLRSGTIVFMNMLFGECPRFVTTEKSRPPRATDIGHTKPRAPATGVLYE